MNAVQISGGSPGEPEGVSAAVEADTQGEGMCGPREESAEPEAEEKDANNGWCKDLQGPAPKYRERIALPSLLVPDAKIVAENRHNLREAERIYAITPRRYK